MEASGVLRTVAVSLYKCATDLRWMGSGPRTGLAEIRIPDLQPGCSIMPGKVNPVIPEAVSQVVAQVIGNDAAVAFGGAAGNFELNVMLPVIARNLLESIRLLATVSRLFADKCIAGIEADVERCRTYALSSPAIGTALNPYIGYEEAAKVVKQVRGRGQGPAHRRAGAGPADRGGGRPGPRRGGHDQGRHRRVTARWRVAAPVGLYNIFVLLHIICAVGGFGAIVYRCLVLDLARRRGDAASAGVLAVYGQVAQVGEVLALRGLVVFGICRHRRVRRPYLVQKALGDRRFGRVRGHARRPARSGAGRPNAVTGRPCWSWPRRRPWPRPRGRRKWPKWTGFTGASAPGWASSTSCCSVPFT